MLGLAGATLPEVQVLTTEWTAAKHKLAAINNPPTKASHAPNRLTADPSERCTKFDTGGICRAAHDSVQIDTRHARPTMPTPLVWIVRTKSFAHRDC
jgi:hypothetical protein